MKRIHYCFGGLLIAIVGCGQSAAPAPNSSGNSPPTVNLATVPGSPDQAVFDFLEAVRTGNDQQAAAMISPLARQKLAEKNLVVAPPGTTTAKFTVGKVELAADRGGAYVTSNWTDVVDDAGHIRTDEFIWVLRGEPEGWRVVGLVTKVFADQPPLVLNFEDPDDMAKKKELLEQAEAGQTPVGQPANSQPQAARPDAGQPVPR